ncbi:SDR family NAD(P)-dependent oxidoreductase [Pseudonocardia xishanensis]|uniref:Sorbitol-6-phosphate dehydrogenase n=1 Tax=Pseudonocardia xishanensis TaxID=630995 RepID=A0ABP8RVL4_9PSEU
MSTIAVGRTAVITGGASGIGLRIAQRLQKAGVGVAVLDLPGAALDAAGDEFSAACAVDVREPEQVQEAIDTAAHRLGGLDTLVLSAGVIDVRPLTEVSPVDWRRVIDVNLTGAFLSIQAAAPRLVASGRGRIVGIASDAGRKGAPYLQAYCASKFGLIGLVESVASELAPHVTANAVCPVSTPDTGMGRQLLAMKTEWTSRSAEEVLADVATQFPMQRPGTPDDVAGVVEFLISDEASFLTGTAIDIDGGSSLHKIPGVASR